MTTPGQQNWAQQAQQRAQQQHQQQMNAIFRRNAADHDRYLRQRRRGTAGPISRLFALVVIAIAVGIFVTILNTAEPGLWHHVKTWFDQIL